MPPPLHPLLQRLPADLVAQLPKRWLARLEAVPFSKLSKVDQLLATPHGRARLQSLSAEELYNLKYVWEWNARPDQLLPEVHPTTGRPLNWSLALACTGRGFGKTRMGAEWIRQRWLRGFRRIALVGDEPKMIRDVMLAQGLLAVFPHHERPHYNKSTMVLRFADGREALARSAEVPDNFRGLSADTVWMDEFAHFADPKYALEQVDWILREKSDAGKCRCLITTTPAETGSGGMRELWERRGVQCLCPRDTRTADCRPSGPLTQEEYDSLDPEVLFVHGTPELNFCNIAPEVIRKWLEKADTAEGEEEFFGRLNLTVHGNLWSQELINSTRVLDAPSSKYIVRSVIAVDPAGTSRQSSDLTGIVVVGVTADRHAYVLADASGRLPPHEIRTRIAELSRTFGVSDVVYESNFGGDWVGTLLSPMNAGQWRVHPVKAVGDKGARARKALSWFQTKDFNVPTGRPENLGRVHLVGPFPALEKEMTEWSADPELQGKQKSPDRLDALAHAINWLMNSPVTYRSSFNVPKA